MPGGCSGDKIHNLGSCIVDSDDDHDHGDHKANFYTCDTDGGEQVSERLILTLDLPLRFYPFNTTVMG